MSSTSSIKPTKLIISPNTRIKSSSTLGYQKPTSRWKINVGVCQRHVSVSGRPESAYVGGFIRDTNGDCVKGFCGYIGWLTLFDAQLAAIQHALQFGWELRKPHVVLEIDSLLAVKAIEEGDENNRTIRNIRDLIGKLPWIVEIKHVKGEANQVAVRLANEEMDRRAHTYHGRIDVLDKPSREIANILKEIKNGRSVYDVSGL